MLKRFYNWCRSSHQPITNETMKKDLDSRLTIRPCFRNGSHDGYEITDKDSGYWIRSRNGVSPIECEKRLLEFLEQVGEIDDRSQT